MAAVRAFMAAVPWKRCMVAITAGMVALEAITWGCQRQYSSPLSLNPLRPDHRTITFEHVNNGCRRSTLGCHAAEGQWRMIWRVTNPIAPAGGPASVFLHPRDCQARCKKYLGALASMASKGEALAIRERRGRRRTRSWGRISGTEKFSKIRLLGGENQVY